MKSTRKKLRNFGVLLIIIIAMALIIQYGHFNTILTSSKKSNIIGYNEDLRDRLNSELEYNKNYINFLSHFIETLQWTEVDAREYFKSFVNDSDIIKAIYFASKSGELIRSNDWNPEQDYNFKKRQWYINAMGKEKVMVSSVYEDDVDKSLIITLSKSIYDKKDNFLGVIAVVMNL